MTEGEQPLVKAVLRTNNPVELSWAGAVLEAEGIEAVVFDAHASLVEGSIGALPRRLMVADEEAGRAELALARARAALADGGGDA